MMKLTLFIKRDEYGDRIYVDKVWMVKVKSQWRLVTIISLLCKYQTMIRI